MAHVLHMSYNKTIFSKYYGIVFLILKLILLFKLKIYKSNFFYILFPDNVQ